MRQETTPESFLPLKPLELLVLTMVADTPRHGYAIRSDIIAQTRGSIEVEAGNLYRHIRRLHADALIDMVADDSDDGDERRRYFKATRLGKRVLVAELRRLRELVRFAEHQSLISPRGS